MFESYVNQLKEKEEVESPLVRPSRGLEFANNIIVDNGMLNAQLSRIEDMTDAELYEFALKFHNIVLENIFTKNDKMLALKLFTNLRFVNVMNQVLYSVNITGSQRIYINKLAYDYWVSPNNKDELSKKSLLNLSRTANRDVIPRLLGLGLPEELASLIAMARFSSLKEIINVKRLNTLLANQSPDLITEEMIVKIYESLFNRITPLFTGIMFDAWDVEKDGEDIPEVFSTINLAILDILEQLPTDMIRSVLLDYDNQKKLIYPGNKVRFAVKAISPVDYPRLSGIIDYLEKEENVFLPQ